MSTYTNNIVGFERFAKLIIHKRYPLHTAIENIKKGDVLALLSLCVAVGSYVVPAQTMIQQGWIDTLIATLMSLPLHDMFLMENIIVALANITADYNYPPMRQRCTEDTFLNTIARLLDTSVQTKDVHLLDPILTLLVNISDDAVAAPRVAGNQTIWDRMVEVYTHPESFSNRSRSLARKAIYCLCFDQVGQLQLSKSSQEFTDFFINDCLHGSLQHPEDLPYLAQYMLVSNPEMYKRFLGQDFVDWLTSLTMKGNTTTLSSLGLMMRQDESLAFAKRVINTKLVKMLAKHAKSDNYDARTLAVEMLTFICVTNGYQLRDVLARMDIEEILSPLLQSRHRETKEVAQQAIKRFKLGTKQEEPTAPMCNFCKRYTTESKRCSACKSVRYCSVDCQKKDWPEHKKICASLKGDDNLQVSSKERDIDRTASKEYVFSHVAEINMLYATSEKSKAEAVTYIDMRFAPPKMVVVTLAELKLDGNERGPEYLHENVAKQMGKRTGGQIVVVVQNKSTVFAMTLAEPEFGEEMMDKFLESIIKH